MRPSGEYDINGDPIPLESFAGNPGHIGYIEVNRPIGSAVWDHMTNPDGTPRGCPSPGAEANYGVPGQIRDLALAAEALELCYGMIWYLAEQNAYLEDMGLAAGERPARDAIMEMIRRAQENFREGLAIGKQL